LHNKLHFGSQPVTLS